MEESGRERESFRKSPQPAPPETMAGYLGSRENQSERPSPRHMRHKAKSLNRLEKMELAIQMRCEGYSYKEIGYQLRMSEQQVARLVHKAFKSTWKVVSERVEYLREVQDKRLEAMYKALWQRIQRSETRAVEVALKILERQARLHGLDAPMRQETTVSYEHMSDTELLEAAKRWGLVLEGLMLPGETELPASLREALEGGPGSEATGTEAGGASEASEAGVLDGSDGVPPARDDRPSG